MVEDKPTIATKYADVVQQNHQLRQQFGDLRKSTSYALSSKFREELEDEKTRANVAETALKEARAMLAPRRGAPDVAAAVSRIDKVAFRPVEE